MDSLYDKVFGCLAASQVGSAMGGPVENKSHEHIKKTFGVLDRMIEYPYGDEDGPFPPGFGEDGVERQKLLVLAITEKKGRITARDLGLTWLKYIREEAFGKFAGQQDEIHYRLVKAGLPCEESGRYDDHMGRMGFNRACHPIGIVNACFPEQAAIDALEVAKIYQPPSGRGILWKDTSTSLYGRVFHPYMIGIDWAAAICAAIAEAFKPRASRESILKQATEYIVEPARNEILQAVEIAEQAGDYEDLVAKFYELYHADGIPYARSRAYEVTSKAFAVFWFFNGDVRQTIVGSVNFGRDTDCLASVAGGLAGAWRGSRGISPDWIHTVDEAVKRNKWTVTQMTIEEQARGLYDALLANYAKIAAGTAAIEELRRRGT
jgi:ADP-ribosylglycohydrolase